MKNKFPTLVEIARAASVTTGVVNGLDAEERDTQAELRSGLPQLAGATQDGIIMPYYSTDRVRRDRSAAQAEGRELRDLTSTGSTSSTGDQGGMTVGAETLDLGAGLRSALVLEKLGARVFGGLKDKVSFALPNTRIAAEWKSETADAPDGSFTFRGLNLEPHRVSAYIDVSWQLLRQGPAIENYLRMELTGALADAIQTVAIAGTGATNQPAGILNTLNIGSVVGGANGAAPTYEGLTSLEHAVAAANDRGHTGWLVSPSVRRKLRRTAMFASGSVPTWAADQARSLLGHLAGVTTSVPDTLTKGASAAVCSAIIHGEFTELFMGFWGPGIFVDAVPFGGHLNGKTRLVATCYFDSGVRAPEAFAAQLDALCAV